MKKLVKTLKTIFGRLPISFHPAFLLVLVYCIAFGSLKMLIIVTAIALIHELGHAVVAARFGYRLKRVRLLPFGAELCGEDLFLPSHEIKIALAGPCVNLLICVFCVAAMWVAPGFYFIENQIFFVSMYFGLFNLLPFFPLDGGRVFVAVISKFLSRKKALKIASILTFCFGLLLCFLFVFSIFVHFNLSLGVMGISLVLASIFSSKNSHYEHFASIEFKRKKLGRGLCQKNVAILSSSTILSAFVNIDARSQTIFVVEDEFGVPLFSVSEQQIEEAANSGNTYMKIYEYFGKNY